MDRTWLPVVNSWRLNERHYGDLQGLNKAETAKKFGDEQVMLWRRSYDVPPPAMNHSDERSERADRRYAKLQPGQVPLTECLKDTVARVLPFWNESMAPAIQAGKRIVVAAHKGLAAGNDNAFYEAKLTTARFYMARVLPQTTSLSHQIKAGAATVMALPAEAF